MLSAFSAPGCADGAQGRPVVTVLCGDDKPSGMATVERLAQVRYVQAGDLPIALRGADVLFVWDFLSAAVASAWEAADQVQWVHIASAGVDPVLFPGLCDSDVILTNSRGVFDNAIAEYVLGIVLAFAKDFVRTFELQRAHLWLHRESERIGGQQVLIVGTGPIGRSIGRLCRAAGCRVAGIGRHERENDPDFGKIHASAALVEHVESADFVIAAAPLTERTAGMFDRRVFAAMKPSGRFINVGRGELAVTGDLIEALSSEKIAGAALDVFETEPLPMDSPLWAMENVIVSPHMSGDIAGWKDVLVDVFIKNFKLWRASDQLENVVDKKLGYVPASHMSLRS